MSILKNIDYICKSQHDFERDREFLKTLNQNNNVRILKTFKLKPQINTKNFTFFDWQIVLKTKVPNSLTHFLFLDDYSAFIQSRTVLKILGKLNSVYIKAPHPLKKFMITYFSKLIREVLIPSQFRKSSLVHNPKGIDFKQDYPNFVNICLFDIFLVFGRFDRDILKGSLVKEIYSRPYFYGEHAENKFFFALDPPKSITFMPTYFHDSDPMEEISKVICLHGAIHGFLPFVYRPHPNFYKSWKPEHRDQLAESGILLNHDKVDDIYVANNVHICDVSSSFFSCILLDRIVFIPDIKGKKKQKYIHQAIVQLLEPHLSHFTIEASDFHEFGDILIERLKDKSFMSTQHKHRSFIAKKLVNSSEPSIITYLNQQKDITRQNDA